MAAEFTDLAELDSAFESIRRYYKSSDGEVEPPAFLLAAMVAAEALLETSLANLPEDTPLRFTARSANVSVDDWDVAWSDSHPLEWLVAGVCGARTVRPADTTDQLVATEVSAIATLFLKVIGPVEALLRFLQRLIRLGRRADAAHQLAVQRLRFACRAARSSPDAPPGEVVVSSSHIPRGPDLPRVTSAVVGTRGERLHLT